MPFASSHQIYYINTLFKSSGTNSNFTYEVSIPPSSNFDRVVVLNASIPNTFYLIQEGFDSFVLREGVGNEVTIDVPPGNYSAKVFASVVSKLMTTGSPNGYVYTVTLPNQNVQASTGKFIYTVFNPIAPSVPIDPQPEIVCTDKVNEQLGFSVNTSNPFADNTLESATTINFGPEGTLFLHSDIANGGAGDILQEFFGSNTETLQYITYQCTAPELYSKALQTNKSSVFRFSLTNEKGQLLDLHGVDMQITICLYKRDNTNELIQKYIKYKVASEPSETQVEE